MVWAKPDLALIRRARPRAVIPQQINPDLKAHAVVDGDDSYSRGCPMCNASAGSHCRVLDGTAPAQLTTPGASQAVHHGRWKLSRAAANGGAGTSTLLCVVRDSGGQCLEAARAVPGGAVGVALCADHWERGRLEAAKQGGLQCEDGSCQRLAAWYIESQGAKQAGFKPVRRFRCADHRTALKVGANWLATNPGSGT